MNNQNTINVMEEIFNPKFSHIIPLLTSPIERFEEEFDKIIGSLKTNGENDTVEELLSKKDSIKQSLETLNKFQKIKEERKKQCALQYYKESIECSFSEQLSEKKWQALNGFINMLKTYIDFVSRNISDGEQNSQVILMMRSLKTHLFDCVNDVMAICNLENIEVPDIIRNDLFNLHIEKDDEMADLFGNNTFATGLDVSSGEN